VNREEDLTKVFERRWKANHDNGVKEAVEREKKFINKMFNVKEEPKKDSTYITPDMRVSNLNRQIEGANSFQKQNRINNIKGKF